GQPGRLVVPRFGAWSCCIAGQLTCPLRRRARGAVIAAGPKLRRDLTVSRLETADGGFLIVKHPVSGRFYRFRAAERFITEQLDGETPLDVIRERTERQFGASLGADTLQAFVQNLDKIGLLDTGKPAAKRDPGRGCITRRPSCHCWGSFWSSRRFTSSPTDSPASTSGAKYTSSASWCCTFNRRSTAT